MTAQLVDTYEGFARLESLWAQVEKAGGVETPFQSFAWIKHWLQYRGTDAEPFILILDDGATIAPFGRSRLAGFRVLSLLGSGDSDFPGLVTSLPSDKVWERVSQELYRCRGRWDLLHLHSVPNRDEIVPALRRHLGSGLRERVYEQCPFVETTCTWESILAGRKNLRYEVKRWARRLEELGELSIEVVSLPLTESHLEELDAVERNSWKWDYGNAAFKSGSQRDFLLGLLRDHSMGARIWLLRISSKLVAYALVLVAHKQWYYYLCVFRKDYRNAGSYLLAKIIEAACSSDCKRVNLLRGDHKYKYAWTDVSETVYEIVCPSNLRGHIASLGFQIRWRAATSPLLRELRIRLTKTGDRR